MDSEAARQWEKGAILLGFRVFDESFNDARGWLLLLPR